MDDTTVHLLGVISNVGILRKILLFELQSLSQYKRKIKYH